MLDALLGYLPGESLGDFGGLSDAASFRDKAWNIDARGEKTAIGRFLDVESDCCFVHVSVSAEISPCPGSGLCVTHAGNLSGTHSPTA